MIKILQWILSIIGGLIIIGFVVALPLSVIDDIQKADGVLSGLLELILGAGLIWFVGRVFGVWDTIKNWNKKKK